MNPLLSRKLVMGLVAIAGIAFSAKLGLSREALYALSLVALACSGSQAVQDLCKALVEVLHAWSDLKPFILSQEQPPCAPPSAPSSPSS
jgi:hypothetical protein